MFYVIYAVLRDIICLCHDIQYSCEYFLRIGFNVNLVCNEFDMKHSVVILCEQTNFTFRRPLATAAS